MAEITFEKFDGINNVQQPEKLKLSEFVSALNIDIDDEKAVQRRTGQSLVVAGATHSLYDYNAEWALYRSGEYLYRLDTDDNSRQLMSGLGTRRLAYDTVGDKVFFTDGVRTYATDGIDVWRAGIDAPIGQPAAASFGAGDLPQASYQYALTYADDNGRESPALVAGVVEATGGISFTNIPVSDDPDVTLKRIYVSAPNGKDLYLALVIPNATTSARYVGGTGMALETQNMRTTMPGHIIANFNGRLLVANRKWVLFTPPYRTYVMRHDDFIAMPAEITMIAPMNDGVWIGTRNEIGWVGGDDFSSAGYVKKQGYGAIKGTVAYIDRDDGVMSAYVSTSRGVCLLSDGGGFNNVSGQRYRPSGLSGAAIFRRGNFDQYIAAIK